MSTYLELCVHARRECRMAGTGPTAVTGQVGELERLVNWVSQAYTEIQNREMNWRWMRAPWTYSATSGDPYFLGTEVTDSYTSSTVTRFSRWLPT